MEEAQPKAKSGILYRIGQWIIFAVAVMFALFSRWSLDYLGVPGVNKASIYGSVAASAISAILLCPVIFWRFGQIFRRIVYGLFIASFFFVVFALSNAISLYNKTPAGIQEAVERAKRDAQDAEDHKAADALRREEEKEAAAQERADEIQRKAESCVGWNGQISALSTEVKDSLQNPHAFEHVRTAVFGNTIIMTFRAENVFGALQTYTVDAKIDPDSCEIVKVGEPKRT